MHLMTRIVGFAVVGFFALLIAALVKDVVSNWGHTVARALALGFLGGCILYQCAHRLRYGHWFEATDTPPTDHQNTPRFSPPY